MIMKPQTSVGKTRNPQSWNDCEFIIKQNTGESRLPTPSVPELNSYYQVHSTKSGKALMKVCPPSAQGRLHSERRNSQSTADARNALVAMEAMNASKDDQIKKLSDENFRLQARIERLENMLTRKTNNSKLVIKSGMGKDEEMMKLEIQNQEQDLPTIKATLLRQITQTNDQYEVLSARCDKLKEILSIFSASIQYNDNLFLKQTEVSKLNELMKKLSETIASTSRTEIELGMKTRELEKKIHDYGVLQRQHKTLLKKSEELERQVEELKQNVRILNDVQARNVNLTITEKNKSSMMAKRMDLLEKNLLSMKEPEKLFNASDSTQKIRNTLNALLKENQELRKKIKGFENRIKDRDRELNKLENKSSNLEKKIREASTREKTGLKITNIRSMGQYHQSDLIRVGFFQPSYQPGMLEKEAGKGLSYRMNILQEKYWKLLSDILEYGSQTFAQNTMEQREDERKVRIEFITDQYLSYRDISERFNLLNILCQQLYQNKNLKKTLELVNNYLPTIVSAEFTYLWMVDFHANEVYTIKDDKEIRMSSSRGLIGHSIITGNAFNGTDIETHEKYVPPSHPDVKQDIQSQMLYPLKGKDGRIIGVIEIDNSHNGVFAVDEEFLLRQLAECLSHTITLLGAEESFYIEMHRHELVEQFQLELLKTKSEQEIANIVPLHINRIFSSNCSMLIFLNDSFLIKYGAKGKGDDVKLKSDAGLCGEIIARKAPSLVIRPQSHPKYNGEIDLATTLPIYYVPLFKTELDIIQDIKPFAVLEIAATQPLVRTTLENSETIFLPIEGSIKNIAQFLGYYIGELLDKNKPS